MNRKHTLALVACLVIIVASGVVWMLLQSGRNLSRTLSERSEYHGPPSSSSVPPEPAIPKATPANGGDYEDRRQKTIEKIAEAYSAPIAFLGKVVDQHGNVVANAEVGYSTANKFAQSGTNFSMQADGRGYFEIKGVTGAVLGVNVSKKGYYQVHNVSNQRFAYGVGSDNYTKSAPPKNERAVFVLQKKGESEPLIRLSSRQFTIPQNGQFVTINIAPSRSPQSSVQSSAYVEKGKRDHYNWTFKITIPGGGLIDRKDQFDFEAPTEGYEETVNVGMDGSDPAWKSQTEKSYFAKLPDGSFARLQIHFRASDYKSTMVLESYFNPEPGHRNLEYDPAKALHNHQSSSGQP